jgi:hypothetical protein
MSDSPNADAKYGTKSFRKKIGLRVRVVHANVTMESLRDQGKGDKVVGCQERDQRL